jgi:hypothetical protein
MSDGKQSAAQSGQTGSIVDALLDVAAYEHLAYFQLSALIAADGRAIPTVDVAREVVKAKLREYYADRGLTPPAELA